MNTNLMLKLLIAIFIDIAGNRTQNSLNSRLAYMYLDLILLSNYSCYHGRPCLAGTCIPLTGLGT